MKDIKTRIVRIVTLFVGAVVLCFGTISLLTNYITAKSSNTMAGFTTAIILTAIAAVGFVTLTFFLSKIFAKKISEPISHIAHSLSVITDLDYNTGSHDNEIEMLEQALAVTERNMNEYVQEISSVLDKLAQGDMQVRIESDFTGSFAQIKRSLNQSLDTIGDTMMRINESASQVASGAMQVASGSQLLSQGATTQASSIQQISASINDLSSKTQENTKNTNKVNTVADEINTSAELSSTQMESMLLSMHEIHESSKNIKKIIKVIEDISFQTNILALNAAVEAARAGAAGKGFAVVADEVRNLANKSAAAAHDTTELIEKSIRTVDEGNNIAHSTADTITLMLTDIGRITARIAKINTATNEQATAILEISQGLDQVSAVVQNNSATAEQSAAASEELSSQAAILKHYVTAFKLEGSGTGKAKAGIYIPTNSYTNSD